MSDNMQIDTLEEQQSEHDALLFRKLDDKTTHDEVQSDPITILLRKIDSVDAYGACELDCNFKDSKAERKILHSHPKFIHGYIYYNYRSLLVLYDTKEVDFYDFTPIHPCELKYGKSKHYQPKIINSNARVNLEISEKKVHIFKEYIEKNCPKIPFIIHEETPLPRSRIHESWVTDLISVDYSFHRMSVLAFYDIIVECKDGKQYRSKAENLLDISKYKMIFGKKLENKEWELCNWPEFKKLVAEYGNDEQKETLVRKIQEWKERLEAEGRKYEEINE